MRQTSSDLPICIPGTTERDRAKLNLPRPSRGLAGAAGYRWLMPEDDEKQWCPSLSCVRQDQPLTEANSMWVRPRAAMSSLNTDMDIVETGDRERIHRACFNQYEWERA